MDSSIKIFNKRFTIALLFFFISALYGWLLRLQKVTPIPDFKYAHFIQAHSHVTFLGWGFLAVMGLVGLLYLPEKTANKAYTSVFYIMVGSLVGLLVSFPIQGYKLFSILFLSTFLLSSYVYLLMIYRDIKQLSSFSTRFIKTGIFYYFLSSMAIWAVAFITIKFGKTDLYHNAIYFYLHFLYNGFFVFILFGLLFRYFEIKEHLINAKYISQFYRFTNFAVIPAYALSLLWNEMPIYVVFIGLAAVILQLISLYYLYKINKKIRSFIKDNKLSVFIVTLVFISYFLKIILQFFSAFPPITIIAVQYKSFFVIGYIHLFTLGFMSLFVFLLVQIHTQYKVSKLGLQFLISGIITSELLLFTQGALYYILQYNIPLFNRWLILVSFLMPLGIFILVLAAFPISRK